MKNLILIFLFITSSLFASDPEMNLNIEDSTNYPGSHTNLRSLGSGGSDIKLSGEDTNSVYWGASSNVGTTDGVTTYQIAKYVNGGYDDYWDNTTFHVEYWAYDYAPCTDTAPPDWIAYPANGSGCTPYNDLTIEQKKIYPMQGSPICEPTNCFVAPYDIHNCPAPNTFDTSTGQARCYYDPTADYDGDGIPNDKDMDADGDGKPDSGKGNDNPCLGPDVVGNYLYPFSEYAYYGVLNEDDCQLLLSNLIDNVILISDKSLSCPDKYCYYHSKDYKCNSYNAADFIPSSDWVYKSGYADDACTALADGVNFSDSSYIFPNPTNCPYTAFCYAKPIESSHPDINNSIEGDSPDLNLTSTDLKPLLQSQNKTNEHLKNLNDKVDDVNNNLDDIKNVNKDILLNNQDMKKDLDKLSLNSDKSLKNQLNAISALDSLKSSQDTTNTNINGFRREMIGSQSRINNSIKDVSANQVLTNDKLNRGLFSDDDPFDEIDFTDDGSSTFGDLEQQVKDSFDVTYKTGLFNLSAAVTAIPTISFNIGGHTFTMLSADMFSSLPIADIRATIIFLFALSGFITVIRTV